MPVTYHDEKLATAIILVMPRPASRLRMETCRRKHRQRLRCGSAEAMQKTRAVSATNRWSHA
jgi:hypothetical protein